MKISTVLEKRLWKEASSEGISPEALLDSILVKHLYGDQDVTKKESKKEVTVN